jgi:hypothetical protein
VRAEQIEELKQAGAKAALLKAGLEAAGRAEDAARRLRLAVDNDFDEKCSQFAAEIRNLLVDVDSLMEEFRK